MHGTVNGHEIVGSGGFFFNSAKLAAPDLSAAVFHVVYQPASHFWPLQLAESGLFVGLAAALVALAAWWTARHTS
jgi:hypothetical protein